MAEPPFVLRAYIPAGTATIECTCRPDNVREISGVPVIGHLHQTDCHITRTLQDTK